MEKTLSKFGASGSFNALGDGIVASWVTSGTTRSGAGRDELSATILGPGPREAVLEGLFSGSILGLLAVQGREAGDRAEPRSCRRRASRHERRMGSQKGCGDGWECVTASD